MLAYMVVRGNMDGPFFRFSDGKPLTKSKFTDIIREALGAVGLPQDQFAGHSFRIGAATKAGIEDSTIRMLGRWNSATFLVYVRIRESSWSSSRGRCHLNRQPVYTH